MLESDLVATNFNPQSAKYRSEAQRLFNTTTNTYYWDWIWNSPTNRQYAFDALNWMKANRMSVRGHTLIWPSRTYMPTDVWAQYDSIRASQGDIAAANYLKTTIRNHITEVAGNTNLAGRIDQWDVMNEPYANNDVMNAPGVGNAEVLEWFRTTRTADPTTKRVLNDYGIFTNKGDNAHLDNFEFWVNYLKTNGVIEGLGEQGHYSDDSLPDLDQLQAVYNRFAAYGLPVDITEFDVRSEDEQLQADFLRDYFVFMFSQPSISGIVQWGFWQGRHWIPNAALYRSDWSIKPNGQAFEDLLYNEWWTEVRGTSRGGQFASKGFLGEYEIVATYNGQTQVLNTNLNAGGNTVTITFGSGALMAPPPGSSSGSRSERTTGSGDLGWLLRQMGSGYTSIKQPVKEGLRTDAAFLESKSKPTSSIATEETRVSRTAKLQAVDALFTRPLKPALVSLLTRS
jgi:GH35 family endo-1,4-beta-xylanase